MRIFATGTLILSLGILGCSPMRAQPAGYDAVPRILRTAMEAMSCDPIERFYERDGVFLPPYDYLDYWQGQSLFALACQRRGSRPQFAVALMSLTEEQEVVAAKIDCPNTFEVLEMPFGISISVYDYDPKERYGADHPLKGLRLNEPAKFLAVEDLRLSGTGRGYLCVDGGWKSFRIH